jgi:hypothetical protein
MAMFSSQHRLPQALCENQSGRKLHSLAETRIYIFPRLLVQEGVSTKAQWGLDLTY